VFRPIRINTACSDPVQRHPPLRSRDDYPCTIESLPCSPHRLTTACSAVVGRPLFLCGPAPPRRGPVVSSTQRYLPALPQVVADHCRNALTGVKLFACVTPQHASGLLRRWLEKVADGALLERTWWALNSTTVIHLFLLCGPKSGYMGLLPDVWSIWCSGRGRAASNLNFGETRCGYRSRLSYVVPAGAPRRSAPSAVHSPTRSPSSPVTPIDSGRIRTCLQSITVPCRRRTSLHIGAGTWSRTCRCARLTPALISFVCYRTGG